MRVRVYEIPLNLHRLDNDVREPGVFTRPSSAPIEAHENPDIRTDIKVIRVVWVDHDDVNRDVGNRSSLHLFQMIQCCISMPCINP